MVHRTATCMCGQLRIEVTGAPLRVSVCHCLECQRRSGSAFAVQARFPAAATRTSGRVNDYVRVGDGGSRMRASFCPTCGSTVFYVVDAEPDVVAVAVGGFADPGFPAPEASNYEERRHAWVQLTGPMRHAH